MSKYSYKYPQHITITKERIMDDLKAAIIHYERLYEYLKNNEQTKSRIQH